MKKEYLTVPNLLTVSRVVFLPLLYAFVLLDMRLAFLITFTILGSTDFFDGLIARKFNLVSAIGKMLDSIADMFFYISIAWFFYRLYPEYLSPNMGLLIAFFSVYFLSFVVSTIYCKKPIMMHTSILRYNAVLVYALVISSYFVNTTYFISVILVIFMIGFVEEMFIFVKFGQVDPDTPSIFTLIKEKKRIQ